MLFSSVTKSYTYFGKILIMWDWEGLFVWRIYLPLLCNFLLINKTLTVLVGVLCERSLVSTSAWVVCKSSASLWEQTPREEILSSWHMSRGSGAPSVPDLKASTAEVPAQPLPYMAREGLHTSLALHGRWLSALLFANWSHLQVTFWQTLSVPLSCPGPWSSIRDLRN